MLETSFTICTGMMFISQEPTRMADPSARRNASITINEMQEVFSGPRREQQYR